MRLQPDPSMVSARIGAACERDRGTGDMSAPHIGMARAGVVRGRYQACRGGPRALTRSVGRGSADSGDGVVRTGMGIASASKCAAVGMQSLWLIWSYRRQSVAFVWPSKRWLSQESVRFAWTLAPPRCCSEISPCAAPACSTPCTCPRFCASNTKASSQAQGQSPVPCQCRRVTTGLARTHADGTGRSASLGKRCMDKQRRVFSKGVKVSS